MKKRILWVVILALGLFSCSKKEYFEDSGTTFHTLYHIKYEASGLLTEKIDAELQAYNFSLNPFHPQSIISKVNRNEEVEVDDWFADVFLKAEEVSEKTGGTFDITCAPLVNLWGFGFSKTDSVTPAMIDSIRSFVGYRKVRLEGRKVIKDDSRILLNCSAIAKGYACDVIARLLEREGVKNYMVEIGGEVTAKGVNEEGECWQIGINRPGSEAEVTGAVQDILTICDKKGIATSGDYRKFIVKDGKRYGHHIDPRSGYPAEQQILSVTILSGDCMTADAYATAFLVLGVEEATALAARTPEIDYYIIYNDSSGIQKTLYSKGMQTYLNR
ncbi:FAD:protein FMN transferase [Parabacteroides sp. Marseille-P3160]|uniref:FAD:protein FMN transferase n=1 Tax=Parabacteroides sp. Marseille-P3160 TaxID=1917887 RepID=UPI0009BC33EE|nr:FAD:protein FMN transferase [Parabacteroides sp. Marseille-P3160]